MLVRCGRLNARAHIHSKELADLLFQNEIVSNNFNVEADIILMQYSVNPRLSGFLESFGIAENLTSHVGHFY